MIGIKAEEKCAVERFSLPTVSWQSKAISKILGSCPVAGIAVSQKCVKDGSKQSFVAIPSAGVGNAEGNTHHHQKRPHPVKGAAMPLNLSVLGPVVPFKGDIYPVAVFPVFEEYFE